MLPRLRTQVEEAGVAPPATTRPLALSGRVTRSIEDPEERAGSQEVRGIGDHSEKRAGVRDPKLREHGGRRPGGMDRGETGRKLALLATGNCKQGSGRAEKKTPPQP
jgi:hypothetical protein